MSALFVKFNLKLLILKLLSEREYTIDELAACTEIQDYFVYDIEEFWTFKVSEHTRQDCMSELYRMIYHLLANRFITCRIRPEEGLMEFQIENKGIMFLKRHCRASMN